MRGSMLARTDDHDIHVELSCHSGNNVRYRANTNETMDIGISLPYF